MPLSTGKLSVSLIILLLTLNACTGEKRTSAQMETERYMLDQARGVYLGMSWTELQRVRPQVRKEYGLAIEQTREGTNEYLFGEEGQPSSEGSTAGRLVVVHMRPKLGSDSTDLRRTVSIIQAMWTELVGTPPISSIRTVPAREPLPERTYRVLTWHPANATLMIQYPSGGKHRGSSTGMLVTVQFPD
jgi:hypothetical protein